MFAPLLFLKNPPASGGGSGGNNNLSGLTVSIGSIAPAFASGTTSYTDGVVNGVTSVSVTPTAANAGAVIKVNGVVVASGTASGQISLAVGANPINIVVDGGSGTKTYTLTVTRAAAGSNAPPTWGSGFVTYPGGPVSLVVTNPNPTPMTFTFGNWTFNGDIAADWGQNWPLTIPANNSLLLSVSATHEYIHNNFSITSAGAWQCGSDSGTMQAKLQGGPQGGVDGLTFTVTPT